MLGQCSSLAHLNLYMKRIRAEGAGRLVGCWQWHRWLMWTFIEQHWGGRGRDAGGNNICGLHDCNLAATSAEVKRGPFRSGSSSALVCSALVLAFKSF